MYSFCPTGHLFAFLTQTQAQFIATEGTDLFLVFNYPPLGHPNMTTVSGTLC